MTLSKPLLDRFWVVLTLQMRPKRGPWGGGPRTMVWAQNTVNNEGFQWFHYWLFLINVFSLSTFKFELWGLQIPALRLFRSVLGLLWPPKVVISLGTSYKNRFYKQFTFTASSKLFLARFLTLLASLMTPKRVSKGGSTSHSFCLSEALRLS